MRAYIVTVISELGKATWHAALPTEEEAVNAVRIAIGEGGQETLAIGGTTDDPVLKAGQVRQWFGG